MPAGGAGQVGKPFAGLAQQRPDLDERHAQRLGMGGDGAARGVVGDGGEAGMDAVLDRGEEGLRGRIGGDRIAAEPAVADADVALDHHQPGCEPVEQAALGGGVEQRGAGRAAADDQRRGDRGQVARSAVGIGAGAGDGAARVDQRLGRKARVRRRHRVGDRQRQHRARHAVGDRGRLDDGDAAHPGLLAQMRAEIAAGADPRLGHRGGDLVAAQREVGRRQHRHELHRAAVTVRRLQAEPRERLAIRRLQHSACVAHRLDAGQLGARHHRQHFGQFGVEAGQRRAAPALEPEIGHGAQSLDADGVAAMDQAAFRHREGLGRVHREDGRERRAGPEPLAGGV